MFAHDRMETTLHLLAQRRRLTVRELGRTLKVSPATLRRDLTRLEQEGKLVRVHGGLLHPQALEPESTFAERSREFLSLKKAMALAAVALVEPRSTVLLDAGTSCFEVGRALMARRDLTLLTNSLPFALAAQSAAARVICLGGEVRGTTGALAGALALTWMENISADWAFIGATGLSAKDGAGTTELSEAAVKQAMIHRARHKVLLADGSKWGHHGVVKFAAWKDFDVWITSNRITPTQMQTVHALGPRVIRVSTKN